MVMPRTREKPTKYAQRTCNSHSVDDWRPPLARSEDHVTFSSAAIREANPCSLRSSGLCHSSYQTNVPKSSRQELNARKRTLASCSSTIMSFQAFTIPTYCKAFFIGLWVETLLYGAYAALFSLCIYIIRRRKSKNVLLITTAIVLFASSTAHLIIMFIMTFGVVLIPQNRGPPESVAVATLYLYVTNNIIADSLIVYRCYVVWGFNKAVIIVPSLLLCATTVLGYGYGVSLELIGLLSFSTSIALTCLTAGRIWWIAHRARKVLGQRHAVKYTFALSIVVESGAIYSISQIIFLIVMVIELPPANRGLAKITQAHISQLPFIVPASSIIYPAMAQITGIVPTLILVRAGLGLGPRDVETFGQASEPRLGGSSTRTPRINIEFSSHADASVGDADRTGTESTPTVTLP